MARKKDARYPVVGEVEDTGSTTFVSTARRVSSDATKEELSRASEIIVRAGKMKTAKELYSSRWAEYEAKWKMLEEDRSSDEKWRANLPDTYAHGAIRMAQAAFLDSEVIPIFTRHQDEDLMRTNDMRDLYLDVSRKGGLKMELYLARFDAMKLGTAFLYTYYEKDERETWAIDKFNPDADEITYTRKKVCRFDDPVSRRLSPYLVFVDEQARADFRATARDAIIVELIPRDVARLRYAHLVGGDEAFETRVPKTATLKSGAIADIQSSGVAQTAAENTGSVRGSTYTFFAPVELADDMVEVLHYWCVVPVDSREIVINGAPVQVKTDKDPSPIPYIHKEIPLTPIRYALYSGDEFWGAGIIELSNADTKAMREYREMMNDRQRISLFSPVFSDVTDEIDQKMLKLKPLSIIRTRGGIPSQFRVPGITSADLLIKQDLAESFKRAIGIDETLLAGGLSGQNLRNFTATAVSFIRQMAFMRLKDFQFLYKTALVQDEIPLKFKLFEQYYSSPIRQASHLTQKPGLSELATKVKEFSVKTGNTYVKKAVASTLFTGPIEDIELDMQSLTPVSKAELLAKWAQVIRDMTPFVEAGILDLSMEKMATEYLDALDVNINKLRNEPDSDAIEMADGEHALLVNKNTSQAIFDKILADGTPLQYLTALHLKRHQQLLGQLSSGDDIGKDELKNLVSHIAKDTQNYTKKMMEQAKDQKANMAAFSRNPLTAGIGAPGTGSEPKPPSVSMSYKDAPDDVRRQMEEAAGFTPSASPDRNGQEEEAAGAEKRGAARIINERLAPARGRSSELP